MGDIEQGASSIQETTEGPVVATSEEDVTATASQVTSSTTQRRESFIDYVPPPPRPVPPPAKYKLWFLVLFCVYFADWFAYEAGVLPWLQQTFNLSLNGALFFLLGCIVCVIIYAGFDLLVFFVRIKIGGTWYGIGPWLRQPRIQWIHEYNNCVVEFIRSIVVIFEDGFAIFNVPKADDTSKPQQFVGKEGREVVLKVENRIRSDKVNEYMRWRDDVIGMGCHSRPGLRKVEEDVIQDEKGDLHVTYFTFESIDSLNEYMTSPVRARLVRTLEPLLVSPSLVQLRKDRELPDMFSDLCIKQSQPVPARPPKKWRVWFITTLSLWFTILITNATVIGYYFDAWGLDGAQIRAEAFVRVLFNTFMNTYVMTPFLMMIFGNWLKRVDLEGDDHEPWRTLNDGFRTIWGKLILFLAYFGSCAIAWGINGGVP